MELLVLPPLRGYILLRTAQGTSFSARRYIVVMLDGNIRVGVAMVRIPDRVYIATI